MSWVTMTHPGLPGRRIEVDEVSMPHHRAAGWQVEPPQETPPAAPKRRRQTRKEGI